MRIAPSVVVSFVLTQIVAAGLALGSEPARLDWPQWRGPDRDAILRDGPRWPDSFSTLQKRWRVSLGPGYSGPIVWGDRIFVTETQNKETEVVRALDRRDGREIWRAEWPGSLSVPFFAKSNGDWIRSTPACDGKSLYVAGIRDVLVCLDVDTGAVRWRLDFPKQIDSPVPSFGFVSSPLLHGDYVYVQAGGGLAKVDKATGALVWKVLDDGGGMNSAFSSPILAKIGETKQLLVQTRQELTGVDLDTGEILWRQTVPSFRGMNILTPTVYNDGVFTSTYKNRSFFYQLTTKQGKTTIQEAWEAKARGYMSSPVVIDDHAYLHLGNGRFCCIDLRTGEEKWRSKPFGKYWSMVAQGKRILALDESGDLFLIDANPEAFRPIDRKVVAENECWAHVAVSGETVLVRDLSGITAFKWSNETQKN
ncbi:MAG: PQQ-binding-like beta-propeller repeat protein [Phycisphaerales bacterium]|nr:PQQ-binding-like beta-propeller repeat protein [Phycisphaerales bacterium]